MRHDVAVRCIASAAFLSSTSVTTEPERNAILSAAQKFLNLLWQFEYKTYKDDAIWPNQIKAFWDVVHTELVTQTLVYDFEAVYGEEVNPPGQRGNVHLWFQPLNRAERTLMKLSLES